MTNTGGRKRIAFIEDHPLMRSGVEGILSSRPDFDYVGGFATPRELIEALAERGQLPDVRAVKARIAALKAARAKANGAPAVGTAPSSRPLPHTHVALKQPENLPLDVVLLDLQLATDYDPVGNVQLLLGISRYVLIYTTATDPYGMRLACAAGAAGIVNKAVTPSFLLASIDMLIETGAVPGVDWANALETDADFMYKVLTPAERAIVREYAAGLSHKEVAAKLHKAVSTVQSGVRDIKKKFEKHGRPATSRIDFYEAAVRSALLPGPTVRAPHNRQPARGATPQPQQPGASAAPSPRA